MKRKISYAELSAFSPCGDREPLFKGKSTLTVRQAIKAGASVGDILWVAGRLGLGRLCAEFANRCSARCASYPDSAAATAAARYASDAASYAAARCASYAARYATAPAARYATSSPAARYATSSAAAAAAASYAASSAASYASDAEITLQIADIITLFGDVT